MFWRRLYSDFSSLFSATLQTNYENPMKIYSVWPIFFLEILHRCTTVSSLSKHHQWNTNTVRNENWWHTRTSKNGIDLSHILLCHYSANVYICHVPKPIPPESCSALIFFRSLSLETEFIWNKLAKKDDHKRDEKMCTNETVLGDSKKQLPKPNGTNRTVRSFVLCLFFPFYKLLAGANTQKPTNS